MAQAPSAARISLIPTSLCNLCQCASSLHPTASCRKTKRSHSNSRQHIRNIMIAAVNGRYAHADEKGLADPEEPAPVSPRRKHCHRRASHMCRRKRASVHASEPLDEFDRCCEISTGKRRRIRHCKRVKGALDGKKYRDEIDRIVRDSRRYHH